MRVHPVRAFPRGSTRLSKANGAKTKTYCEPSVALEWLNAAVILSMSKRVRVALPATRMSRTLWAPYQGDISRGSE